MKSHFGLTMAVVVLSVSVVGCSSRQLATNAVPGPPHARMPVAEKIDGNPSAVKHTVARQTAEPKQSPGAKQNRQGIALYRAGKVAGAIEAFNKAIRLDSESASVYYNRGTAYLSQQKYEKALTDYGMATRWNPRHTVAHRLRGTIHMSLLAKPDHAAAITDFRNALASDSADVKSHKSLAFLLSASPRKQLRDAEQAATHAARACELTDWKDAESLLLLSSARAAAGDYVKAAREAKRALKRAEQSEKEHCRVILAHYEKRISETPVSASLTPRNAKLIFAKIAGAFNRQSVVR